MKRLTFAVILTGLLGTGCATGAGRLGTAPPAPSTTATQAPSPTESESPSASPTSTRSTTPLPTVTRTITYQVWFVRGGRLFATRRTEPFSPAIGRASLEAMLAGPSAAERAAGVGTSVPSGTALRGLAISSGIARVDFSGEFRRAGATPFTRLQIGQVVYTIGQFSTVKKVVIEVNGGEIFETPQTKAEYEVVLPAIVVYSPTIGSTVGSPVTISGTANVFEATVSLRILDENGHEIARGFTTATCGTGCRGDYSTTMSYTVDHEQRGTVEVFESSAKDGSAINVQKIPVTLIP
jgi:hypothetical protein